MSGIWLPPLVSPELRGATQRRDAELSEMFWIDSPVCEAWNRELAQIDPHIRLGQAKPDAEFPGVRPGFYHIIVKKPGAPAFVLPPFTANGRPDGEFAEPTSRMLDDLRASDLQNARVVREQARRRAEAERAREREKAREDEERQEELRDRLRAAQETSVSMNTDAPWSQNVQGLRGVRKRPGSLE